MKLRRGFRRITLPIGDWQYKIGRSNVVAYSEDGQKFIAGHDVILGLDWESIYRYRRKHAGTNHRANITPVEIAEWIQKTRKKFDWLERCENK